MGVRCAPTQTRGELMSIRAARVVGWSWHCRLRRPVRRCFSEYSLTIGAVLFALAAQPVQAQGIWGPTSLGTLGGDFGQASSINDVGQVVGFGYTAGDTVRRAFLWTAAGGMVDLGTLGGTSSSAHGINNAGQVVGDSDTTG